MGQFFIDRAGVPLRAGGLSGGRTEPCAVGEARRVAEGRGMCDKAACVGAPLWGRPKGRRLKWSLSPRRHHLRSMQPRPIRVPRVCQQGQSSWPALLGARQ